MDYEQFSQDVTATAAAKRAVDEFAKKQVDGLHICPRCGRLTVKARFSSHFLTPFPDAFSVLLGVYLFFLTSATKLHFFLGVFFHFIIGADSVGGFCKGYPPVPFRH